VLFRIPARSIDKAHFNFSPNATSIRFSIAVQIPWATPITIASSFTPASTPISISTSVPTPDAIWSSITVSLSTSVSI
jgi:hypothetical protein